MLTLGKKGEEILKEILLKHAVYVIETRDFFKTDQKYKGPSLWGLDDSFVLPDFEAIKNANCVFVESKLKRAISFFVKDRLQQHGINTRHYLHYMKVSELSGLDIWIVVIEVPDQQKIIEHNLFPSGRVIPVVEDCVLCAKLNDLKPHHKWESNADAWERFGNNYDEMIYFNRDQFSPIKSLFKHLDKLKTPKLSISFDPGAQKTLLEGSWSGSGVSA